MVNVDSQVSSTQQHCEAPTCAKPSLAPGRTPCHTPAAYQIRDSLDQQSCGQIYRRCWLTSFGSMSALGQGMRLGTGKPRTHSACIGNSLLVLHRCPLPAKPLRKLRLSTTAMGRKGLAELLSLNREREYAPTDLFVLGGWPKGAQMHHIHSVTTDLQRPTERIAEAL